MLPEDYHAIGLAITHFSWLEYTLGSVIIISEFGVGGLFNDIEHSDRFKKLVKKTFRDRADSVIIIISKKTNSDESKVIVKDTLDSIISWRNFVCHGVFLQTN